MVAGIILAPLLVLNLWVVDIKGGKNITVLRGNEKHRLHILDELREGDIININGFSVSLLDSAALWRVEGKGKVKISGKKPVPISGDVKVSSEEISDEQIKLVEDRILLNSSGIRLKSVSGELLYPVNLITDKKKVIFRWKGNVLGKLEIMDSHGNKIKVIGVKGKWASTELERGKRYCWRVITKDGRNIGETCFYIASEKEVEMINKKGEEMLRSGRKYGALLWAIYLEKNHFYEKAIEVLQKIGDERLKFKINELKRKLGIT